MAADEAGALSNIHLLLDTLESQQHSTVASLNAKEVGVARNARSVKIPCHTWRSAWSLPSSALSWPSPAPSMPRHNGGLPQLCRWDFVYLYTEQDVCRKAPGRLHATESCLLCHWGWGTRRCIRC